MIGTFFVLLLVECTKTHYFPITTFTDPYVKIKLLDRKGKRIGKKKKTSVKMGNLNPYYNESFVFLVEQEQLRVNYVILCVIFVFPLLRCFYINIDFLRKMDREYTNTNMHPTVVIS